MPARRYCARAVCSVFPALLLSTRVMVYSQPAWVCALMKGDKTGILPSIRNPRMGAAPDVPGSFNRDPIFIPIPPDSGSF